MGCNPSKPKKVVVVTSKVTETTPLFQAVHKEKKFESGNNQPVSGNSNGELLTFTSQHASSSRKDTNNSKLEDERPLVTESMIPVVEEKPLPSTTHEETTLVPDSTVKPNSSVSKESIKQPIESTQPQENYQTKPVNTTNHDTIVATANTDDVKATEVTKGITREEVKTRNRKWFESRNCFRLKSATCAA